MLREAGVVNNLISGEKLVDKKLRDGSARKKFGHMLHAQGVDKYDVRQLLKHKHDNYAHMWHVLPQTRLCTHLCVQEAGKYISHQYITYDRIAGQSTGL